MGHTFGTHCLKTLKVNIKSRKLLYKFKDWKGVQVLHVNAIFTVVKNIQSAVTCSKLTMGTLEQGVKYVQS